MAKSSHYDKDAADYAVAFIENLRHTKGIWAGKPFELIGWQEQIVRDLFGTVKENGYRQFNTAYVEIPKKMGKQLSLDTLIPTPEGFTTMGEIKPGDTVFDERGNPCRVVAKSPVDYDEQAYRITFKDGEVIEAGERHQWRGEYTYGKRKPCVMTTGDLYRMPKDGNSIRFRIAVAGAICTAEKKLPVHPYLMGYWLGNGHATKPEITVRTRDIPEVPAHIQPHHRVDTAWLNVGDSVVFRIPNPKPVLVKSFRNKVIPPEYLRASYYQRLELLRGLMDSDGAVSDRKGQAIYTSTEKALSESVSELLWSLGVKNSVNIIPEGFYRAFYSRYGRNNIYHLESYIRALLLQKILGIPTDKLLLDILKCSFELTDFRGFDKIPDVSAPTRFKQRFADCLAEMFEKPVDLTEPTCREIDAKRADYLIYDTTGITFPVAENNPKYLNGILKETNRFVKKNPKLNPYGAANNLMPSKSETNPDARQQYINGHFCYAAKVGILTNGLGIPRHIALFDGEFRKKHPEIAVVKTGNPDFDKEIGDSKSLRPVMSDFRQLHSSLSFKTFLGDSAFDSYDNYAMLHKEFGYARVCVPMNTRNSKNTCAEFDGNGTPVCPIDRSAFTFPGESGGRNRSRRFKWVCPKSVHVKGSSARVCTCESPCTSSSYGRCVNTYPDKDFRFYPGIPRGTEHWDNLYRHRVVIERTIHTMKDTFALDSRRSHNTVTAKADVFIAGIVQLVTVILADAVHKRELFKSIRKLIA